LSTATSEQYTQIQLMYGEYPLNESTTVTVGDWPGFTPMSPLHEQLDFKPGGPFSSIVEPLTKVLVYERNETGGIESKVVNYEERYGVPDAPNGAAGPYASDCAYMSQLLGDNDTFSLMFNLAMTQDSRDPDSVWQMMNRIELETRGFLPASQDTTFWNTKPLDLIAVVDTLEQNHIPISMTSLLGGADSMELINYVVNHTGTTLGEVLRSLQIPTETMVNFIIDHLVPDPADAPEPFPQLAGIWSTSPIPGGAKVLASDQGMDRRRMKL
jgi:hypothetical protein